MQRSTGRIFAKHVGSLPRPDDLLALVQARANGKAFDFLKLQNRLREAVRDVVARQRQAGLDVVSDGEFGKPGFIHYVNERLAGFAPSPDAPQRNPWAGSREALSFPEYYASLRPDPDTVALHLECIGPIHYKGHTQLRTDIENLKSALSGSGAAEAFMPAISPTNVEEWQKNRYYKTAEEYLFAIAEAMREEYKAIVEAGFVVQIDDPRLTTQYIMRPGWTLADVQLWAEVRVEALNHALRGIPEEHVRFHTCYSIDMGPRVHDMELKDMVDLILKVRAGAYSFEAANPRHEHEWRVWESARVPEGKILIPGVITQSTVLVEHPDLIADRIERFARVVGRENVIAGADCGFAAFAGRNDIHPTIVWAKLAALTEGARRASCVKPIGCSGIGRADS
jgi:5-methyltetrahydropteroyltriglutamate--homocysteine methyltransferase